MIQICRKDKEKVGDPFHTAVFRKELAHHAFRKKPFIHIPLIVPEVPPQFGQQFRLRHCERNIRKAGLSFELGGRVPMIPKRRWLMIQICRKDKEKVYEAICTGKIDAAEMSFPNLIDDILFSHSN